MSILSITPDTVVEASGNLQNLGAALRSANAAAASQTTAISAPAADEVSAAITSLLGTHAQEFQALSTKAAAFHDEFVNLLNGGAAQYLNTELTNAQQTLTNTVNAPARALLGQPAPVAAAARAVTSPTTQSFNFPFGPFTISGNQTFTTTSEGFSGATNAAVSLNTPVGPVGLFSGSGSEAFNSTTGVGSANFAGRGPWISASGSGNFSNTTGAFSANFAGTAGPFISTGGSLNGTVLVSGTGSPQITGLSLVVDGIPVPVQFITPYLNGLLQAALAGS
jgi:hypothetical protein